MRNILELVLTTSLSGLSRLRQMKLARRFARREDGAVAIEFGIVVAPFIAILFAIIETALVFFAGQTLETAVADSARLILTGQAQTAGYDQAAFKNAVCSRIYGLFDCANGLYVDVKNYSSFANINLSPPVDANKNFQNNFSYSPGGPGCITVVRLYYQWPTYVSLLGFNLSTLANGKRLLAATAAFRNEPYSTSGSC